MRKGTHLSEESRRKISRANKGRVRSEEFKRKVSATMKGRMPKNIALLIKSAKKFKKGHHTWNKGKKRIYSEETKRKMREGRERAWSSQARRKRQSKLTKIGMARPDIRKRISKAHKGKPSWNKGKEMPQLSGAKHPAWKGGISFVPYTLEWTRALKKAVRKRDKYTCQVCGKKGEDNLAVHHIDYNKKNCNLENLVTLCKNCHTKTNWNRKKWTEFFEKQFSKNN